MISERVIKKWLAWYMKIGEPSQAVSGKEQDKRNPVWLYEQRLRDKTEIDPINHDWMEENTTSPEIKNKGTFV